MTNKKILIAISAIVAAIGFGIGGSISFFPASADHPTNETEVKSHMELGMQALRENKPIEAMEHVTLANQTFSENFTSPSG